jgi:hypothetical protein
MSLSYQQMQDTIKELKESLRLSGLSVTQVAHDLNTSEDKIERILNLEQQSLEYPWILKNYLTEKIEEVREKTVTFTTLVGYLKLLLSGLLASH